MPFYEYECKNCGHALEAMQKINDSPLRKCPHCGKQQLQRLMSAPVFRLKGSGWYETDFKGDQDHKRNLADQPDPGSKELSKDLSKDAAKDGSAAGVESKAGDGKAGDGKAGDGKAANAGDAGKPVDKPADRAADKPKEKTAAAAGRRQPASRSSKRGAASHPKAHARRAVKKPIAKSKRGR